MTNEELREMCAKIAEKKPEYRVIGFGSVQCRIAKSIRAIQLPVEQNNTDEEEPQRTPEQWAEHSAALHRIKNALPVEQSRKDFATSDGEGGFKDLISQFRKAAWERDIDEMLRIQKFIFDLVENEIPEQEPIKYSSKLGHIEPDELSSRVVQTLILAKGNLNKWDGIITALILGLKAENDVSVSFTALEKQVAELTAKNAKLQEKALSAEKWRGIASAKFGDGRTVQQIEIEAEEPLLKQVAELKLSLRAAIETIDTCGISFSEESMKLARERAK